MLDLPEVVQVAAEFIESFSLSDRISTLAADFNFDAFPSDIDVAIMASNLPMYGETRSVMLYPNRTTLLWQEEKCI